MLEGCACAAAAAAEMVGRREVMVSGARLLLGMGVCGCIVDALLVGVGDMLLVQAMGEVVVFVVVTVVKD